MDEERPESQEQEAKHDVWPTTAPESTPTAPAEPAPTAKSAEPEPEITLSAPVQPTSAVGVKRMGMRKALFGKASLIGAALVLIIFLLLLLANRDEISYLQFLWSTNATTTTSALLTGFVCGALLVLLLGLALKVGKVSVHYGDKTDRGGEG